MSLWPSYQRLLSFLLICWRDSFSFNPPKRKVLMNHIMLGELQEGKPEFVASSHSSFFKGNDCLDLSFKLIALGLVETRYLGCSSTLNMVSTVSSFIIFGTFPLVDKWHPVEFLLMIYRGTGNLGSRDDIYTQ